MWAINPKISEANIENTPFRDGISENSYVFKTEGKTKCEWLKDFFGIEDHNLFDEKFKQACNGSGQEETRITTLHSSSLCAQLFFYKVTETSPIYIVLDDEKIKFTESIFEYQNKVTNKGNPSNIDITLLGTGNGQNVILFLESKFSEYIIGAGKTLKVKSEYLKNEYSSFIYNDNIFENMGLLLDTRDKEQEFKILSDSKTYLEGLKQMISHYVGVIRFIKGTLNKEADELSNSNNQKKQLIQEHVRQYMNESTKVYLGTILFDDKIGNIILDHNHNESYLENYGNLYRKLAETLNVQLKNDGVLNMKVLQNILTYKNLFTDSKNEPLYSKEICDFYF
ncbi:MAG: hypothetical protein ACK5ML_10320 [Lachnospiraceae bacterium]